MARKPPSFDDPAPEGAAPPAGPTSPAGPRVSDPATEHMQTLDARDPGDLVRDDTQAQFIRPAAERGNAVVADATARNRPAPPATGATKEIDALRVEIAGLREAAGAARDALLAASPEGLVAAKSDYDEAAAELKAAEEQLARLEKAAPGAVVRYARVTRGGFYSSHGSRAKIREGKIVDSLNYDFAKMQQSGIKLKQIAAEERDGIDDDD